MYYYFFNNKQTFLKKRKASFLDDLHENGLGWGGGVMVKKGNSQNILKTENCCRGYFFLFLIHALKIVSK